MAGQAVARLLRPSAINEGARFEIALEHIAWAARFGFTPREVILSVQQALPVKPTWADAVHALVYAQHNMERGGR